MSWVATPTLDDGGTNQSGCARLARMSANPAAQCSRIVAAPNA
jgi:hypothetical protein